MYDCCKIVGGGLLMKLLFIVLLLVSSNTIAEQIGEVSTKFRAFSANDKIVIEAFEDPDIKGVSCFLSRAKTGGVSGAVGLAEDRSEASISCVKTLNTLVIPKSILGGKDNGVDVFKKSTSIMFKSIQVVRFYDAKRQALVYLTYSDKLIEGSPDNGIFALSVR